MTESDKASEEKQPVTLKAFVSHFASPAAAVLSKEEQVGAQRCLACGHRCLVRPDHDGICRVRFNRNGVLFAPSGYVAGLQVDPVEKKPFFHVLPGSGALSFGMLGCNLHCGYCQNWISSQALREGTQAAPPHLCSADDIVRAALSSRARIVVSTYNEPLISAEWAFAVFSRAKRHGLLCGFVSNGNATPEVLDYLKPVTDLYKVDLKSFNESAYRALGCQLSAVLDTIERLYALGYWVEVVTLLVPGFNDTEGELREMAQFLAGVSPDLPWHVTAFHPDFKMQQHRATTAADLHRAWQIGRLAGLRYVYAGNLPGQVENHENTYCPNCEMLLVERRGFSILQQRIIDGHCAGCDTIIPGRWS